MQKLDDFLTTVFTPEYLQPEDEVCFWSSTSKHPSYPVDVGVFKRHLAGNIERAMYMGTSTVARHGDGKLYNRMSQFTGLWVIVLDDIGSGAGAKCAVADLPGTMWEDATYRVATSPDNFQLGYVLEAPVRDLNAARELVRLIYGAGPWDSGGALATKLVRVPAGVNLKDKYADDAGRPFHCYLDNMTGYVWTPDELLTMVDAGVGWQDILEGTSDRKDPRRGRGATAYSHPGAKLDLQGVVDPMAEWLQDSGYVKNIRYPWMDIDCPWSDDHTEGSSASSTSYSPLGWGEDEASQVRRAFHCFHGHCKDNKTQEFLEACAAMGAPRVAGLDPLGKLLTQYVLDGARGCWVNIMAADMSAIPDRNFKLVMQQSIWYPKPDGSYAFVQEYAALAKNEGLLRTGGLAFEPGGDLILPGTGHLPDLNQCRLPFYGSGPVNQPDVDKFVEFIRYLMPYDNDADFFLRHLAMKVQHPKYRGPGIFMYTNTQGTGRGTLATLLGHLWGKHLITEPSMKAFVKYIVGGPSCFNMSLQALWVIVPEAKDGSLESGRAQAISYETLKQFITPDPVTLLYNEKNVAAYHGSNYASTIICSNFYDGIQMDLTDRRIRSIKNTVSRAKPEFFSSLYEWLKTDWTTSVWRWLSKYDCGDYTGTEPQNTELSETGRLDQLGALSPISLAVELATEAVLKYSSGVMRAAVVCDAISLTVHRLHIDHISTWKTIANSLIRNSSSSLGVVRVDGKTVRLRVFHTGPGVQLFLDFQEGALSNGEIAAQYEQCDTGKIVAHINDRLDELGHN